jgi:hypothetical protein
MAIVAGIVALGTAAAATGAAAAAGSYGIYKYFKRRRQRRRPSRDGESELDFGQELEVYVVTETRIPPPVAPKPKREGRRATVVVTKQPASLEMHGERSAESSSNCKGAGGSRSTASWPAASSGSFITRLCPNAVKVLPDPPLAKHQPDSVAATAAAGPGPGVAMKSRSHDHRPKAKDIKDSRLQSNDNMIVMKTLQHKLEEEHI